MKKRFLLGLLALLILPLTSCSRSVHHNISEYVLNLDISEKEDFRILQLSDIHIAAKDDKERQFELLEGTIQLANPDFIVITGDCFTFADKHTIKQFVNFFDKFNIPWTLTFGNHDEQVYCSVDWLTSYFTNYGSNLYFKDIIKDDVFGNANFAINLNKNGNIFEQIIIMDSNRYQFHADGSTSYDYIKENQIEWYSNLVDYTTSLNGGNVVKSHLFFHIPLCEFQTARDLWDAGSDDVICLNEENGIITYAGEGVSCPDYNSGFFDKIVEKGSTNSICVGHDHKNNYILRYKGVDLGYGVNGTDRIYFDDVNRLIGGRVITIHSDHTLSYEDVYNDYK